MAQAENGNIVKGALHESGRIEIHDNPTRSGGRRSW